MEIEVGEYVRFRNGEIDKVKSIIRKPNITQSTKDWNKHDIELGLDIEYESGKIDVQRGVLALKIFPPNIEKHSKNIIDLIEDEDIVILEYYVRKYGKRIQRRFEVEIIGEDICFLNNRCSFLYSNGKFIDGKGFNVKIKEILTKELFNQNSYKF